MMESKVHLHISSIKSKTVQKQKEEYKVQAKAYCSTYSDCADRSSESSKYDSSKDDLTVSSKLKLLEQELINLEKVGKGDLSKVRSLMRKQAKRYHSPTSKIDDLCRRMQVSDPCESTMIPEFRTQQQNEFLLEASHLQRRASETRQKLSSLQAETTKSCSNDELSGTRRCLDTIGNNLREMQRNLEIWLARIVGNIEGVLSRNRESGGRDYYSSRYTFVRR